MYVGVTIRFIHINQITELLLNFFKRQLGRGIDQTKLPKSTNSPNFAKYRLYLYIVYMRVKGRFYLPAENSVNNENGEFRDVRGLEFEIYTSQINGSTCSYVRLTVLFRFSKEKTAHFLPGRKTS